MCYNGGMKVKHIGMVLFASFLGIMLNPEVLAASDSITISDLDRSSIVETVLAPGVLTTPITLTTPKAGSKAKNALTEITKAKDQVKFSWGEQNLKIAASTKVDAGTSVMKYGRLLWAHNSTAFNNIKSLKIGDTFTVSLDGTTKKYQVKANPLDQQAGILMKVSGEQTLTDGETEILTTALTDRGFGGHDLVLLTCAGNGNSHRFIVVADEI